MRYLFDSEFRPPKAEARPARPSARYAAALRYELSRRNLKWAHDHHLAHEASLGAVPAVLYREDDAGNHGNFLPAAYERIKQIPTWLRRLDKVHTSAKRALLSRDKGRRELDSSNSSDALLMNIFCYPDTLTTPAVRSLLGVDTAADPLFGYRPGIPFTSGRRDSTEIDMKLGDLLIEAKLTEYDFQRKPTRLIDRYRDLHDVFDTEILDLEQETIDSYQLIRGALAAYAAPSGRFCVLCDERRPDLIASWHQVLMAVKIYDLRCRLLLLTWQELADTLPTPVQSFLAEKYGIISAVNNRRHRNPRKSTPLG